MHSTYFFHLGKNPLISLAEIEQVFASKIEKADLINREILKVSLNLREEELKDALVNLGGTKKISKNIQELPTSSGLDFIILEIIKVIEMQALLISGKMKIGINTYNLNLPRHRIGMDIKKILKYKKISCRIVESSDSNLNSISIIRNKLTSEKGLDLNIIADNEAINLTKTICCQNSIHYSKRDYGRPRRNAKVGMLPPKLSQMMLNFAEVKEGDKVLDPFCGIGTVLQEGILRKLKMFGSDIAEEMVDDSEANLTWLNETLHLNLENDFINLMVGDAREISDGFSEHKFQAIVTEGTLGPPQKKHPEENEVKKIIQDLISIYEPFFEDVKKIMVKTGKIVITFPIFRTRKGLIHSSDFILPQIKGWQREEKFQNNLINNLSLVKSKSFRLIYEREDQFVLREIIILKPSE